MVFLAFYGKTSKYLDHSEQPPFREHGLYIKYSSHIFAVIPHKKCALLYLYLQMRKTTLKNLINMSQIPQLISEH